MTFSKGTSLLALGLFPSSAKSAWSTGEFFATRELIFVPDGEAGILHHCSAGDEVLSTRAAIFTPDVDSNEIVFDAGNWTDPPNDWNTTINENIVRTMSLTYFSGHNVKTCSCVTESIAVSEFLAANARVGPRFFGIDAFQSSSLPPFNFYWNDVGGRVFSSPRYVPNTDGAARSIQAVKSGDPLFNLSYGWIIPEKVTFSQPLITNSKFVRVEIPSGKSFALYATSDDEIEPYEFEVRLVRENQSPDNLVELSTMRYSTSKTDIKGGTKQEFSAATEGHYYFITVFNDNESDYNTDFTDLPYLCSQDYLLRTKNSITFSVEECSSYVTSSDGTNRKTSLLVFAVSIFVLSHVF